MSIWDIFGGGDTSKATDQAINSVWQGNQAYNWAAHNAEDILRQTEGQAIGYLQPYYDTGTAAQKQYAGALGVPGVQAYDPSQMVKNTPGYQFGLSQGNDSMNAQMSAQGMYGSGPQRQAAQKFGQNYGMNYYNQLMNSLQGLGQQGMKAGGQMGNWATNMGTGLAGIELGMGKNAQNTYATTAGMELQNQQNQSANTQGWLGTGLNFLTGGLSGALGGGSGGGSSSGGGSYGAGNFLGNLLGPLFSGAGGGGGGDAGMYPEMFG